MSALKGDQLQVGSTVYMVDFGGTVVSAAILAVKKRTAAKTQICLEKTSELVIVEFYDERFFPTEKEAWYAVAMFAQRSASTAMANAATAFKKAGIASDAIPDAITVSAAGQ